MINNNDQNSTLSKLKLLRDRYYAHTDSEINITTHSKKTRLSAFDKQDFYANKIGADFLAHPANANLRKEYFVTVFQNNINNRIY